MRAKFIGARHGSYDGSHNLDDHGKKQMERLATSVQEAVNGGDLQITLLCSTAPRAEQGGKILVKALEIPKDRAVFHECLWDDNYHPGDYETSKKLVDEHLQNGSLVLLVSHLDLVPGITDFAAKKLGVKGKILGISYGQGLLVAQDGISVIPKNA